MLGVCDVMVTRLKDIAAKVGRSVTTVSRALNDYDDVSPETRDVIKRAASEMGYQPNIFAQRLRKRSSDTIGFIIPTYTPRFSDPFFSEFLAGIGNKASEYGYDLLVSTQAPGNGEMKAYRHMVDGHRVDGLICVRTCENDPRINYLIETDFPFVAFGRVGTDKDYAYIDVDGGMGMSLVVDHLVQLGYRRIAAIFPDIAYRFSKERLRGLEKRLKYHGIQLPEEYIRIGDLTQNSGYEQANQLLGLEVVPKAIAAGNDLMAFGAISAIQEHGLVVGRDMAVTGFDDTPLAEHFHPPLTTVHQPVYQIGIMACEMLIERLQGRSKEFQKIIIQPELMIRKSCGEMNVKKSFNPRR